LYYQSFSAFGQFAGSRRPRFLLHWIRRSPAQPPVTSADISATSPININFTTGNIAIEYHHATTSRHRRHFINTLVTLLISLPGHIPIEYRTEETGASAIEQWMSSVTPVGHWLIIYATLSGRSLPEYSKYRRSSHLEHQLPISH